MTRLYSRIRKKQLYFSGGEFFVMNVILCGMMGAGKTCVGIKLSELKMCIRDSTTAAHLPRRQSLPDSFRRALRSSVSVREICTDTRRRQ